MAAGREVRTIVATSAALSTAVLPVFLVGALSDEIRADLGIGEAAIGAAITVLLGTAGLTATTAGRITERLGAPVTLRMGVAIAGLATAGVGALAGQWWHMAVAFAAVGIAVGLIDTGAARTFADRVRSGRQGTAFGIKEASVPGASLLAGVALPTLGVTFGWRATFVAALAVALLVGVSLPRPKSPSTRARSAMVGPAGPVDRAAVIGLATAVGIGAGAANAAAAFLAPSVTAAGGSAQVAGTLLAAASLASIAVRIGAGRWADRPGVRPTPLVAALLVAGAAGAGLLVAAGAGLWVVVVGAVVVLGGGWGWTGLAFLAAVRARPHAPAAAAGTVLAGIGIGGAFGPLAFGALVQAGSYEMAWAITAAAMALAAALTAFSERAPRQSASSGTPG